MPSIKPVSNIILTQFKKNYSKVSLPQTRVHDVHADIKTKKYISDPFADDDDDIIVSSAGGDSWSFCGDLELGCLPLLSF